MCSEPIGNLNHVQNGLQPLLNDYISNQVIFLSRNLLNMSHSTHLATAGHIHIYTLREPRYMYDIVGVLKGLYKKTGERMYRNCAQCRVRTMHKMMHRD